MKKFNIETFGFYSFGTHRTKQSEYMYLFSDRINFPIKYKKWSYTGDFANALELNEFL